MYQLDIKDRKILYELDKNSRQSLAQLSKKTGLSKQVINYRLNALVQEGVIKRFYTELNYGNTNSVVFKLHIQLENVNKEIEDKIYKYFEGLKCSTWVVSCSGKWDMICGVAVHDIIAYNHVLTEIMNNFSKYIHNKEIITNIYLNICNRKWLMPEERSLKLTCSGGRTFDLKLDEKDFKILDVLSNNSRAKLVDLATTCNLKPNMVKYRIKQLEKKGVINAYRISLNLKMLGKEFCKAFLYLHQKTDEKERMLIEYCKSHPNVTSFIQCIGSWDFEIESEVDNIDQFHSIMKEIRSKFDFVRSYEAVTITREFGVNYNCRGIFESIKKSALN